MGKRALAPATRYFADAAREKFVEVGGNAEVASNLQSAINMGTRQAQEQALLREGSNLVVLVSSTP